MPRREMLSNRFRADFQTSINESGIQEIYEIRNGIIRNIVKECDVVPRKGLWTGLH